MVSSIITRFIINHIYMNKYGISEAKSRVGFKTYAVQKNASINRQSLRGWLLKGAVFVSAFSLVVSVFTPVGVMNIAQANHDPYNGQVFVKDNKNHKVDICHAPEGQDGSKYNQQNVDIDSIFKNNGHNSHSSDIIPPFHYKDKNNSTNVVSYPGKNWTGANEEIWGADCKTAYLTLVKGVDGGNASATDWTLSADGPINISGSTGNAAITNKLVPTGTYTLSESGGPNNYTPSDWTCVEKKNNQNDQPVAVANSQVTIQKDKKIVCTIVNTYDAGEPDPDPCDLDKQNQVNDDDCEEPDPCDEQNIQTDNNDDCEEPDPCDEQNIQTDNNDDCEDPNPCDDIQTQGIVEPCPPKELKVKILKVWEGYEGLPSNHDDITLTVDSSADDEENCKYEKGDLDCEIDFYEGSTIDVEETGLPAGWEVDPATVGNEIVPNCSNDHEEDIQSKRLGKDDDEDNDDDFDCTHTVINRYQDPKPCGQELVINGGFELPEVTASQGWDIFPSGSVGMGWSVDWINEGEDTPDIGNMELHEGVNGWDSHSGNQHTELDSDWGGPTSNQSGEDASVRIYQDLITKVGSTYTVKFWTSPRPGISADQNKIQFKVGNLIDLTVNEVAGGDDTVWTEHVYTFIANAGVTRLSFADAGSGNSLGGFLDDVSVKEDCLSDVTVCKVDNAKTPNPLSGWTVMLKGDKLETVSVDSALIGGANSTNTLESGQTYLIVAKGTWQNRTFENVDARFTTPDSWATQLEAPQGGYPDNLLELQVDGQFVDWSSYSSTHEYNVVVTGDGTTANFGVFDGDANTNTQNPSWFGDNIGSLTVDIYPVYTGVTGENGCVTIEDVPYDTYKLDEIMQDGWENVSGQGRTVTVNESVEPGIEQENQFKLVNECTSEECEGPMLHLIKVVCQEYNDVQGNADADNADDTGEKYTEFWNYNNGTFSPSPLINGFVHPNEIPVDDEGKDCSRADGWKFKLASNFDQTNDVQEYTTVNGEYMTPISELPEALQQAIRGENEKTLWISEVEQDYFGFAALRCYNDALNGDNLEYINIGDNNPDHIYCIAYNVELEKPCVEERVPVALISETDTNTAGYTTSNPTAGPLNPSNYEGGFVNSALANTVIPPWIDPAGFAPFTGSGAKWISTNSMHPGQQGGEGGDEDQWRLFQKKFTVPSGVNVTPGTIYFTADNAVSVYLNGSLIDDTSENLGTFDTPHPQNPYQVFTGVYSTTFTPVAGQENTLEFVVRNSGGEYGENPTALLYRADFVYTIDCGGGNEEGFDISGIVYNDQDQDNTKDAEEPGLPNWTVNLFEFNDGESLVDDELSDSDGNYLFSNLDAGCYIVREVPKENWTQTEPNVINHEYFVSLGNAKCPFVDDVSYSEGLVTGLFIKTAHAADSNIIFAEGDAVGLNFGNYTTDGSSTSGGGGGSRSSGSRDDDDGRVLGDSTGLPYKQPEVLGASTELPRTGTPISAILMLLASLGIILVPSAVKAKRSQE